MPNNKGSDSFSKYPNYVLDKKLILQICMRKDLFDNNKWNSLYFFLIVPHIGYLSSPLSYVFLNKVVRIFSVSKAKRKLLMDTVFFLKLCAIIINRGTPD